MLFVNETILEPGPVEVPFGLNRGDIIREFRWSMFEVFNSNWANPLDNFLRRVFY